MLKSKKLMISLMAISVVVLLVLVTILRDGIEPIDYTDYRILLETDGIKKAQIEAGEVVLFTVDGRYSIVKDGIDIKELLKSVPIQSVKENTLLKDLFIIGVLSVLIFALLFYGRKKEQSYIKKERERYSSYAHDGFTQTIIKPTTSKQKFSNIAGISEVKEELQEIVDFLKNSSRYKKFGITLPRGVLLIGPPGVGKTMIAKAVAGEAEVPFFYQSGASFVQIYVGMGAKRVRELFSYAKANAPSIIFIDEIDAVGKARGGMRNDERESTLNELLTQMDGFEDSSDVIVIGATNKIEVLDEALLRSGRFDRRIFIPMPDFADRVEILRVYLAGKPFRGDVQNIAKMSVGFSGAALATLVNEAAINALRRDAEIVDEEDFVAVRQKVLLGKKKVLNFSDDEKRIQASYQAAKALCAYWFEIDFDKITIINDRLKDLDLEIESKTQMFSKIKVYLAGIAIAKIRYNEIFSNSTDDLIRAREIAKSMSEFYGMGKGLVPHPEDISTILNEARDEVEKFLLGMGTPLDRISKKLFEDEGISREQVKEIVDEIF
jgi:ATP-dependent metalloprotease FtsH